MLDVKRMAVFLRFSSLPGAAAEPFPTLIVFFNQAARSQAESQMVRGKVTVFKKLQTRKPTTT